MKQIVFATNNAHKLDELRAIVGTRFKVLSLSDIGCHDEIPEDSDTLAGNALQKARWVAGRYGCACLSDDTGLMVDALDGAPGVHTARYAGPGHDSAANVAKLLANLEGVPMDKRTAHFSTVIAYIDGEGGEHLFEGRVDGHILTAPTGDGGFGYDPVFRPEGWTLSFAQADPASKNAVSHRGRATRAFMDYLTTH